MNVKVYKRINVPKGFKRRFSKARKYVSAQRSWFGSRKERFYK